jgi:L-alanine-DL-glutamate epimerase-like enolase superfamily enzyme
MTHSPEILRIEALPFGIPIRGFADVRTAFTKTNAVLVRIHASDGTVSLGEACVWEPEFHGETIESITAAIVRYAAPRIVGMKAPGISPAMAVLERNRIHAV